MTVDLGTTLFSVRPLSVYRAMFALTDGDLTGRVLDCPGGAASFTAEVAAAGGDAVAVDPVYDRPAAELAALARDEARRGNAYTAGNAERYVWTWFSGVVAHHRARLGAAEVFAGSSTSSNAGATRCWCCGCGCGRRTAGDAAGRRAGPRQPRRAVVGPEPRCWSSGGARTGDAVLRAPAVAALTPGPATRPASSVRPG